jgi:hypothetical protein
MCNYKGNLTDAEWGEMVALEYIGTHFPGSEYDDEDRFTFMTKKALTLGALAKG